jgi:LytS/YehU family sensor histidine kinase
VQVEITGDYKDKLIAPLLLIPFVENSFKHGASVNRGKQWLRLNIQTKGKHLCFDLSNSKSIHPTTQNGKKGIGLMNVNKRLQLIYPGRHLLQIISTDMAYAIHLEMVLDDEPLAQVEHEGLHHRKSYSYAG